MTGALRDLIHTLALAGHTELVEQLQAIEPRDQVQALVLRALGAAVDQHGLAGVQLVGDQLERILSGEEGVRLDLSNLRLASDTLAAMQRLEAEDRSAARELITRTVATIGPVVKAVVALVVGGLVPKA